ncbi:hypothetical protein SLEP1_g18518 [Rubroshorea leprosula]|uniref:Uncharacterized protein n=1 Tax=Rubroshorea leprosula TaxID=152421 RepID=A0AAV5J6Y5_9ROSI|nr:hypothetical protein SLEP1_g18518 [Rubroshorea leprosula]
MNAEDLELDIDFVQCDIKNLGWRGNNLSPCPFSVSLCAYAHV